MDFMLPRDYCISEASRLTRKPPKHASVDESDCHLFLSITEPRGLSADYKKTYTSTGAGQSVLDTPIRPHRRTS